MLVRRKGLLPNTFQSARKSFVIVEVNCDDA